MERLKTLEEKAETYAKSRNYRPHYGLSDIEEAYIAGAKENSSEWVDNQTEKPSKGAHVIIKFIDGSWTDAFYVGDLVREITDCEEDEVWWNESYFSSSFPSNKRWSDCVVTHWMKIKN